MKINTPGDVGRFWEKVDTGAEDECWEWTSTRHHRDGYGQFKLNGKQRRAHRVACLLDNGEDPGDSYVLHTCDNPPCVNSNHLYLGTQSENIQDSYERGRKEPMSGEASPSAKLTYQQVAEIKDRLGGEHTHAELASEYGVAESTVSMISSGENWGEHP